MSASTSPRLPGRDAGGGLLGAALLVCVGLTGCPQSEPQATTTGSPTTAGSTTGAGASTTYMTADECMSSEDCETGGSCVAPYDPMPTPTPTSGGSQAPHGPSACVAICIEENDLTSWCTDHDSCCGQLRCNPVDGFCEPVGPAADSGDSGAGTTSAGSSGGGSTTGSTSSSGSTDSGASESSSTDSGSTDSGSTGSGSTESGSGSTDSGTGSGTTAG